MCVCVHVYVCTYVTHTINLEMENNKMQRWLEGFSSLGCTLDLGDGEELEVCLPLPSPPSPLRVICDYPLAL